MIKKLFANDLKTLSVIIFLVAVIALISVGAYSSFIMSDSLIENIEVTALSHLKSSDSLLYEKTKDIQRFADSLSLNEPLRKIINETEDPDEFNRFMKKNLSNFETVEACVLLSNSGKGYVYNMPNFTDDHLLQLQVSCRHSNEKTGFLQWYNIDQSEIITPIFNKFIVCSTSIFSEQSAKLYIFVKKNTLNEIVAGSRGNTLVSVLDEGGRLIVSNNHSAFSDLFYSQSNNLIELYTQEQGLFSFKTRDDGYVGVHYKSMFNNFKFLEIHQKSSFYSGCYKIIIFMFSAVCLFLLVIVSLYIVMYKQFLQPLKKLGHAMQNFSDNSLYTQVEVIGNNEVSMLTVCFNTMIVRINEIIENIKQKDKEKNQAEMLALRRQIQPHFIYNTLNTIRILAIYNNQTKIAESLQVLARLLKTSSSSSETFWTLDEDIAFIKDYIFLLQICYKNLIDVSYNIDEKLKNCLIPSMIIQPIVENAIRHGLAYKLTNQPESPKLYISTQESNNLLLIEITDNGIGMSKEQIKSLFATESKTPGTSIGIKNISERIKLTCGEQYGLTIKSQKNLFTTVILQLPLKHKD